MKTLKILAILLFLALTTCAEASDRPKQFQNRNNFKPAQQRPAIGAPLDGGILAILGVAGAAYFAARKRKKNEKS